MIRLAAIFSLMICVTFSMSAQDNHVGHDHSGHDHSTNDHSDGDHSGHNHGNEAHSEGDRDHGGCGHHGDFDVAETAMHHISDANVYSIGPLQIPLPIMLKSDDGWELGMSSKFNPDLLGHGDGHIGHNRYVLHGGIVKRIADASFPMGEFDVEGFMHSEEKIGGKKKDVTYVCTGDAMHKLEQKSTFDGGLFGGGMSSYKDFSLTKNVTSMLVVCIFLFWIFRRAAKAYKKQDGEAPKGLQGMLETFVIFIRDEVAIPFLGHNWEKYFTFLLSVFFFILGLNLFGQIPFFGGSNVTGNLAVTMVLALLTFLITNFSGNAHYWKHLLVAPGVPFIVKLIIIPVELMGLFIKPLTLMLRLFANITAGHIVMVVFIGFIFIFGKSGESLVGAGGAAVGSTLLTMFMMAIELIVALVQAFVFTILTASYIGAATEEAH